MISKLFECYKPPDGGKLVIHKVVKKKFKVIKGP